jgi:hypothetical protein
MRDDIAKRRGIRPDHCFLRELRIDSAASNSARRR